MGAAIPVITAIGSVLGGVASIVSAFKAPKISFPKVNIPQADLNAINQAIEQNKQLSEQARQAINQAIENYQQGKLTPQYQALLDEWWDKTSKQLAQRLAAMGLSNSTMAVSAFAELQRAYLANQANLLTKQLQEALSLTGLSQQHITDLMNKASLQMKASYANAQNQLLSMQISQGIAAQKGQSFANLGQAFADFGQAFGVLKAGTPSTSYNTKTELAWQGIPQIKWSGRLGEPVSFEWR